MVHPVAASLRYAVVVFDDKMTLVPWHAVTPILQSIATGARSFAEMHKG
jgi:hypothetical protein